MLYKDFALQYMKEFFNPACSEIVLKSLKHCDVSLIWSQGCQPTFRIEHNNKVVFVTPRTVNGKRHPLKIRKVVQDLPLEEPSEGDLNNLFLIILEGHNFNTTVQDAVIRMLPYATVVQMWLDSYRILRMYLYYKYDPDCKVYISPYSVNMFRSEKIINKVIEAFIEGSWNYYAPKEVLDFAVKKNITYSQAAAVFKLCK